VIPERECLEIKFRKDKGKGGRVSGMKTKYKLFSPKKRILRVTRVPTNDGYPENLSVLQFNIIMKLHLIRNR
jgi:hypothetical protein